VLISYKFSLDPIHFIQIEPASRRFADPIRKKKLDRPPPDLPRLERDRD
jgi:hypothetical protein